MKNLLNEKTCQVVIRIVDLAESVEREKLDESAN